MAKYTEVPLSQIVPNPFRNMSIYPVDEDQIKRLRASMKSEVEWIGCLVGRRRDDDKVEIAYGHARVSAARRAGLDKVPVEVRDLDDDLMLMMMTDENALQGGSQPGAIMNEVTGVLQILIDGIMRPSEVRAVRLSIAKAFSDKAALEMARTKLLRRAGDHEASVPFGYETILRYLGGGNPENVRRSERSIRETVSALKQSGVYDEMIDAALKRYPALAPKGPAKDTAVVARKPSRPHERVFDERTASVFATEGQLHAFRDSVTTTTAKKVLPVEQQLPLAKKIMQEAPAKKPAVQNAYIAKMVQVAINDAVKEQREIDKEEREAYLAEQVNARIDAELASAESSLRSMIAICLKMERLAREYPGHPKIGGFAIKLERLGTAIQQFIRQVNKK